MISSPQMRFLTRCLLFLLACSSEAQEFHPNIPKSWGDKEVEGFEVPLAQRDRSPRYMSSAEYYKLQVLRIYRSYPALCKGRGATRVHGLAQAAGSADHLRPL